MDEGDRSKMDGEDGLMKEIDERWMEEMDEGDRWENGWRRWMEGLMEIHQEDEGDE